MSFERHRAKALLIRAIEAYENDRFEEAAEKTERAIEIEPSLACAHLTLGVVRLTQYLRACFKQPDFSTTDSVDPWDEFEAYREREKKIRAEQNLTTWPLAESSLKRANELDPQNKLVVEYLAALYFYWKDLFDMRNDGARESIHWLERLKELDPENKYADAQCAMILIRKARQLLPHFGKLPFVQEPDLESCRAEVGPLLDEARRHANRALTLEGGQGLASHYLNDVTFLEFYLIDPESASRKLEDEVNERSRSHQQFQEFNGEGSVSETITFEPIPGAFAEDVDRRFPPNPWRGLLR